MSKSEFEKRLILDKYSPEMFLVLKEIFQVRAPCFNFDFSEAPDMEKLIQLIRKIESESL